MILKFSKNLKKKKPLNLIDGIWEHNLDREQKLSFFNKYVEANLN